MFSWHVQCAADGCHVDGRLSGCRVKGVTHGSHVHRAADGLARRGGVWPAGLRMPIEQRRAQPGVGAHACGLDTELLQWKFSNEGKATKAYAWHIFIRQSLAVSVSSAAKALSGGLCRCCRKATGASSAAAVKRPARPGSPANAASAMVVPCEWPAARCSGHLGTWSYQQNQVSQAPPAPRLSPASGLPPAAASEVNEHTYQQQHGQQDGAPHVQVNDP